MSDTVSESPSSSEGRFASPTRIVTSSGIVVRDDHLGDIRRAGILVADGIRDRPGPRQDDDILGRKRDVERRLLEVAISVRMNPVGIPRSAAAMRNETVCVAASNEAENEAANGVPSKLEPTQRTTPKTSSDPDAPIAANPYSTPGTIPTPVQPVVESRSASRNTSSSSPCSSDGRFASVTFSSIIPASSFETTTVVMSGAPGSLSPVGSTWAWEWTTTAASAAGVRVAAVAASSSPTTSRPRMNSETCSARCRSR